MQSIAAVYDMRREATSPGFRQIADLQDRQRHVQTAQNLAVTMTPWHDPRTCSSSNFSQLTPSGRLYA